MENKPRRRLKSI